MEQLIAAAHARVGTDDELALLDAVIAVTQDLSGQADEAVDQVVRQVRAAGHSWTVIGERLGVSRQAARQKYADRVGRLTDPARRRSCEALRAEAVPVPSAASPRYGSLRPVCMSTQWTPRRGPERPVLVAAALPGLTLFARWLPVYRTAMPATDDTTASPGWRLS
ncbi:hypothetical protein [Streptomyces sp. bgisy034]|uniref:hypothetical protein n=1 Tax=Streptomyces sp. bgisy034 TaxID=3413774 RepID=UPI003EBC6B58